MTKPRPQKNKSRRVEKTVKAWAILHEDKKRLEDDGEDSLYLYKKKPKWFTGGRTVPCTITYPLP